MPLNLAGQTELLDQAVGGDKQTPPLCWHRVSEFQQCPSGQLATPLLPDCGGGAQSWVMLSKQELKRKEVAIWVKVTSQED